MLRRVKSAIRLSRKDWHSTANRAVLWAVLDDGRVPGFCPAGLMAEVGLRWWRRKMPQNRKGSPMTKPKSKRHSASHSKSSKTAGRNSATLTSAHNAEKLKVDKQSAVSQRRQSSVDQTERPESKQARIIAMLRAPSGATIEVMMHATGWQQHSVRGFLAGVIRKKLGLNLVSAAAEGGRIYRITERTASRVAAVRTGHAA
jgi:hypothetical protein